MANPKNPDAEDQRLWREAYIEYLPVVIDGTEWHAWPAGEGEAFMAEHWELRSKLESMWTTPPTDPIEDVKVYLDMMLEDLRVEERNYLKHLNWPYLLMDKIV